MRINLFFLLICLVPLSCTDLAMSPEDRDFNVMMQYGITAKNEINTFHDTYTKDLILDGTITIHFVLPQSDLDRIKEKAMQIDFFSYPDEFFIQSTDSISCAIFPFQTYRIRIKSHSTIKTVFWEEKDFATDLRADKLKELIDLIREIVESKRAYQQLPKPNGGYGCQ
jgi:hypothetical protein